jgi:hypothetical protein
MAARRSPTVVPARSTPRGASSKPQEIADDLQAALAQIQDNLGDLQRRVTR